MNVGDRVRVNGNEPMTEYRGTTGVVIELGRETKTGQIWKVSLDSGGQVSFYESWLDSLEPVSEPPSNRSIVLEYAQRNRDAMLDEIDNFKAQVEAGTLGDFSELGFLTNLLQALIKE